MGCDGDEGWTTDPGGDVVPCSVPEDIRNSQEYWASDQDDLTIASGDDGWARVEAVQGRPSWTFFNWTVACWVGPCGPLHWRFGNEDWQPTLFGPDAVMPDRPVVVGEALRFCSDLFPPYHEGGSEYLLSYTVPEPRAGRHGPSIFAPVCLEMDEPPAGLTDIRLRDAGTADGHVVLLEATPGRSWQEFHLKRLACEQPFCDGAARWRFAGEPWSASAVNAEPIDLPDRPVAVGDRLQFCSDPGDWTMGPIGWLGLGVDAPQTGHEPAWLVDVPPCSRLKDGPVD